MFSSIKGVKRISRSCSPAAASGLYLFGFTYLWVGINALAGLPARGLGWFSLFVAVVAMGFAGSTWAQGGRVFAVIWILWAVLWGLFFLVLGLEKHALTRFTGAVAVAEGIGTAAIPAWLSLTGAFEDSAASALVYAIAAFILLPILYVLTRVRGAGRPPAEITAQSAG
ncbi:AmiS/UreI family transporter [Microbacterium sp. NPDC091662]|uniref:AmiS/UreI family transporter n=1 Tax=Microbacterium sp. NPDC091662 TaxID=3364211 RepID=UPI00381A1C82